MQRTIDDAAKARQINFKGFPFKEISIDVTRAMIKNIFNEFNANKRLVIPKDAPITFHTAFEFAAQHWMEWSRKTFVNADEFASLDKLYAELAELIYALKLGDERKKILHEYVDVMMCLLHSAAKYGFTFEEIKDGFLEKSNINYGRQWQLDENGKTYSHKK